MAHREETNSGGGTRVWRRRRQHWRSLLRRSAIARPLPAGRRARPHSRRGSATWPPMSVSRSTSPAPHRPCCARSPSPTMRTATSAAPPSAACASPSSGSLTGSVPTRSARASTSTWSPHANHGSNTRSTSSLIWAGRLGATLRPWACPRRSPRRGPSSPSWPHTLYRGGSRAAKSGTATTPPTSLRTPTASAAVGLRAGDRRHRRPNPMDRRRATTRRSPLSRGDGHAR